MESYNMQHTKSSFNTRTHEHNHSQKDSEICSECIEWMKKTADKCRTWSKESSSAICKGSFSTSAFVCDSIASSMDACMAEMKKQH